MSAGVRVKMCGMTRVDDAQLAADIGADAIGLIFYRQSPRCVDLTQAAKITNALPPFIKTVAVLVNPTRDEVNQLLDQVAIDILQFHGDESAEFCNQFRHPYIKAMAMRENTDLFNVCEVYKEARALLLDAYHPQLRGGSGCSFDWQLLPQQLDLPLILAGGLNLDNIADAVNTIAPYAIDICSGIEREHGIKDHAKMRRMMQLIREQAYE